MLDRDDDGFYAALGQEPFWAGVATAALVGAAMVIALAVIFG